MRRRTFPSQAGSVRGGGAPRLVGQKFDCADDVAVLDGAALVGIVPIERLLASNADARIADVMDSDPPVVTPGVDQELVAWKMVERAESSMPVVDAEGRFAGLIPPHRMLGVLLAEHDEDLARLGGYLAGTSRSPSSGGTGPAQALASSAVALDWTAGGNGVGGHRRRVRESAREKGVAGVLPPRGGLHG